MELHIVIINKGNSPCLAYKLYFLHRDARERAVISFSSVFVSPETRNSTNTLTLKIYPGIPDKSQSRLMEFLLLE